MFGACSATQAEMEHTSASLEESVTRMRESVAAIREIEIRIQRIAVNAMIRATHIGPAGNALNVIAEVMQKLALDSNAGAEDAAGTLDAMTGAASCVGGGLTDGAASGAGDVIGEMRHAVLELHSSSERSFSHVNQIAALGAHLAEDIGAVRGGFSAGRLFAEVVGRARGELERIGAQAGQEPLEGAADAPEVQLESLTRRYTMQTEREVHQSAAGGLASESAAPTAASSAALADGDLGDNVELF
jgi:hypothetical protein